jgi:hypothetical protein
MTMTKEYRKLDADDLKSYGIALAGDGQSHTAIKKLVEKYYPKSVQRALVIVDNEYNDEYYTVNATSILCYDNKGNIVNPLKGKEVAAMKEVSGMRVCDCDDYQANPVDDFVVHMETPELYVLEDNKISNRGD